MDYWKDLKLTRAERLGIAGLRGHPKITEEDLKKVTEQEKILEAELTDDPFSRGYIDRTIINISNIKFPKLIFWPKYWSWMDWIMYTLLVIKCILPFVIIYFIIQFLSHITYVGDS